MFRFIGLLAIIPATVLLTISFFVVFALRKAEGQPLKAFGYVITALLWLGALLIFSFGIYTLSTGRHPCCELMKPAMRCPMMHGDMTKMMPAKNSMMQCTSPMMQSKGAMMQEQNSMMGDEKNDTMMKH